MCHECSRFLSQTKTPELHVRQTRQQLQQETYHNFSGRHFSNILIIKLVPLLIINTLAKCSVMSAMHGPIVIGNSMQVVTCCRLWTHYKAGHVQLCHLKGDTCLKFLTPHPFILKSTEKMYKITIQTKIKLTSYCNSQANRQLCRLATSQPLLNPLLNQKPLALLKDNL